VAQLAAVGPKRCTLELGGNAPVVVCKDVDAKKAAASVALSKFRDAGQVCVSPSRFFVHESIARPFADAMADISRSLKLGPGIQAGTQMGALANERRQQAMIRLTDDALSKGASIEAGGQAKKAGFFFLPTVLSNVSDDMAVMQEEIFGPIVPVSTFSTLEEVIRRANAVPQGLAGHAYTNDIGTAHRLADELEVGMLGINHAFVSTAETRPRRTNSPRSACYPIRR